MTAGGGTARAGAFAAAAATIWTILYGRFGHGGDDGGFILALAYRLTLGEVPYVDFLYVRPPGSILLHSLPMLVLPDRHVVIFERWLFYVFMAVSAWISTRVLCRRLPVGRTPGSGVLLALLVFVASVQHFPAQPWHTVDGILFAVLAVGCAAGAARRALLPASALFLLLAMACKQSFFFLAPLMLVYVLAVHGARPARTFALVLGSLAAASALLLASFGALGGFLSQTAAVADLGSLGSAGLLAYLRPWKALLAVALPTALVSGWPFLRRWSRFWPPVLLSGFYGAALVKILLSKRFEPPALNHPALLFILVGLAVACDLWRRPSAAAGRDRSGAWTLALMLAVSWCASLSWGYQTPQLYSAPLIVGFVYYSRRLFGTRSRRLIPAALVLALVTQWAGYSYPYRDEPRGQLGSPLGEVFHRMSHVRTSSKNQARYAELKRLWQQYGDRFTVLPGLPLAAYLTQTVPPLPVDWAMNVEVPLSAARQAELLDASAPVVFLEKDAAGQDPSGRTGSALYAHVRQQWQQAESGEFFDVYRFSGGEATP